MNNIGNFERTNLQLTYCQQGQSKVAAGLPTAAPIPTWAYHRSTARLLYRSCLMATLCENIYSECIFEVGVGHGPRFPPHSPLAPNISFGIVHLF